MTKAAANKSRPGPAMDSFANGWDRQSREYEALYQSMVGAPEASSLAP